MAIFKHMFIITALTISCNALGMFGFGRELRHNPQELKEISQEQAKRRKETTAQTHARHDAEFRKRDPEAWNRYQKGGWYNEEEIERKQEQARIAQFEAMLARQIPLQSPVSKQTAQDFAISNQNFEEIKTRRLSTEKPHTSDVFKCPRDKFVETKLNKTTAL
jgi:hypothetical protein